MASVPSSATDLDRLGAARYVSLTTRRRDGTPVATPVWVVRDGDHLAIWTNVKTGKVKRVRRNPAVTLAPCTIRGRLLGEPVEARAVLMSPADTAQLLALIKRKYGIVGRLTVLRAQRRPETAAGIRLHLSDG
jgi:PPOX class probable F420-dependent enzyme